MTRKSDMALPSQFEQSQLSLDGNIATAFERIAAKYPDRPAIHHDGQSLCYADLDIQANTIAALVSANTIVDTPIVVFLPQGGMAIAAMIGVLKAGSFFPPLDIGAPSKLNARIISASGAKLILTETNHEVAARTVCGTDQIVVERKEYKLPMQHQTSPSQLTQREISVAGTEVWQSLLSCEHIDDTDDFFSLGGDSMLLVRVQQALDRRLNLKLTLAELYEAARFDSQVTMLSSRLKDGAGEPTMPIYSTSNDLTDLDDLMSQLAQIPSAQ